MSTSIPRIPVPSREEFLHEFVYPRRPVVLTNLFEGQRIREVNSVEAAKRILGEMPIVYQRSTDEEFHLVLARILAGLPIEKEHTDLQYDSTVAAFLKMIEEDPKLGMVCPEVPSAKLAMLDQLYELPAQVRSEEGGVDEFSYSLWLGNRGYLTQLHYDGDYRSILQYQLFGEKRVLLIPAESSPKLVPIFNTCLFTPDGLVGEEREEFLRYHHAHETVVRGGDAILIPSCAWHYFEYGQISMSLSLRFGQSEDLKWLSDNLHNDYFLQQIAASFVDPRQRTEKHDRAMADLRAEFARPAGDRAEKRDRILALSRRIHGELCRAPSAGPYLRSAAEQFEAVVRNCAIDLIGLYGPQPARGAEAGAEGQDGLDPAAKRAGQERR